LVKSRSRKGGTQTLREKIIERRAGSALRYVLSSSRPMTTSAKMIAASPPRPNL
jgi:hypothetical protein